MCPFYSPCYEEQYLRYEHTKEMLGEIWPRTPIGKISIAPKP